MVCSGYFLLIALDSRRYEYRCPRTTSYCDIVVSSQVFESSFVYQGWFAKFAKTIKIDGLASVPLISTPDGEIWPAGTRGERIESKRNG